MKFIYIFSFLAFTLVSSCKSPEDVKYNGYVYWVFVSDRFAPSFDQLKVGDVFGEKRSIFSYPMEDFGEVFSKIDENDKELLVDNVSTYFVFNDGQLSIEGRMTKSLKIVILKAIDENNLKIIHLHDLGIGNGDFDFDFNSY